MHQTRQEVNKKIPIKRKGTKYVAVPSSHKKDSVSVLVAVRDMLNLAENAKEVKKMIQNKKIKINGKVSKDIHDSIKIMNILEADKEYRLTLTNNGRYIFEPYSLKEGRVCKIVGKSLVKGGKKQWHLHDGTNILSEEEYKLNDSIVLDEKLKVKKQIHLKKDAEVLVIEGRHIGYKGKISEVDEDFVTIQDKKGNFKVKKESVIAI